MISATQFEFPLSKANYLLNHTTKAGVGGDKRKFWREVIGFDNPEAIREAILETVSLEILQKQDTTEYGERYRAYVKIRGYSGKLHQIRTVWIILAGEDVVRFVTAVPSSFNQ
ncbi:MULTISPECIES: DUF6883 domain-containing protein [unclassified Microcystis]|jgi:hypothetical protein|uniref:DUF6883 domain-containing protein n=1 Tax=unclassified Microcystis TaxID=2643300 RepID=UPI0002620648|nr:MULTISPECIES: DUF6883 domain-containing protein [unclassified Microcystis]AVQ72528.1 hypothetical protein B5D77_15535 [Microcystis sp. MC19]CCI34229.1 conserved hypothetical protein [Microcystis sp. T1-4]